MIIEALIIFVLLAVIASVLIWPIVIYRKLDLMDARMEALENFALECMREDDEPDDGELSTVTAATLGAGRLQ